MQSLTLYGRMVVRAMLAEVAGETPALAWRREASTRASLRRSLRLVTASAGLSKVHSSVNEVAVARAVASAPTAGPAAPQTGSITSPSVEERTFGDDAFFIGRHRLGDVLGVADGVGGWRTYGVDPSLFATSLMTICERMVREGRFNPARPVDLLAMGLSEVQMTKAAILGSCTACVVALHRDENTLYTANLGDSGFLVVRGGRVVHRSEEQQHYFNTPYQLAVAPPGLQGMVLSDRPESASKTTFRVEEGDIILLGTDGLFDNMKDEQILRHLELLKDYSEETIQRVAISIVAEAHHLGFDPNYLSPFSKNAAASGFDFIGGKPDDVTVLIARVTTVNCDQVSSNDADNHHQTYSSTSL